MCDHFLENMQSFSSPSDFGYSAARRVLRQRSEAHSAVAAGEQRASRSVSQIGQNNQANREKRFKSIKECGKDVCRNCKYYSEDGQKKRP